MAREELDFDHRHMTEQGGGDADKNLAVRFYKMPLENAAKSANEGRPIFEDVEMLEIRVRGDRNNVIIRPVRPGDKRRFRDAWAAYQEGITNRQEGTPLGEWPPMTASMVEELKYLQFFTVEQVAGANDDVCGRIPGLVGLKLKAKAFIELAKGSAPIEKLTRDLQEEKSRREAAERHSADLGARIASLEALIKDKAPVGGGAVAKTR